MISELTDWQLMETLGVMKERARMSRNFGVEAPPYVAIVIEALEAEKERRAPTKGMLCIEFRLWVNPDTPRFLLKEIAKAGVPVIISEFSESGLSIQMLKDVTWAIKEF